MNSHAKNLAFVALLFLILFACVEKGMEWLNYPASPVMGWSWEQSPYRGEINRDDHQVNQLGLRGQKIAYTDQDKVVLLVGDSQVEAGTQRADHLPEALLQAALRAKLGSDQIKVFSIAAAGWGQDQQLLALGKYFTQFRADLVLVWPTPVNDYWENTFVDRSVTPEAGRLKPTFQLVGEQLIQVLPERREWKLQNLIDLARANAGKTQKMSMEQVYLNRWLKQLPSTVRANTQAADCPKEEVAESRLIEAYWQGKRAYTLLANEDVAHSRSHFSPFLSELSERDQYAIAVTHRLLSEIKLLTQAHSASFAIFHGYRNDLDAAFQEIKCVKQVGNAQVFAYDGSDWLRYLKRSSLQKDLISLTLEASHPLNVAEGDWHLGEEGNRLVMEALATRLAQHKSLHPH